MLSIRYGSQSKGYGYLARFGYNPILRPFSSRVIFFPVVTLFWNQSIPWYFVLGLTYSTKKIFVVTLTFINKAIENAQDQMLLTSPS